MIQTQIKLRINKKQEVKLNSWLLSLTRVWNWGISKIGYDAKHGIYHKEFDFVNLLANHSKKLEIPSHTLQAMLKMGYTTWQRCFKKIGKKPRFKGIRNKLSSIPFPDPIKYPTDGRVKIPMLGLIRYHKQDIPQGKIKCGRIVKRASGWYLCLFIDSKSNVILPNGEGKVGIDPGYKTNLTLSNGVKIDTIKHFKKRQNRLAQAQRGKDKKLTARLQERIKNRRKDANHKLSHKLVQEYDTIVFSKDNIKGIAKKYGKSVAEAGHYQLRQMLSYKCSISNRKYIEVDSKYSTMTCHACLSKNGPTGISGLQVRQWECSDCGVQHDRDINAAINTLIVGLGTSLERCA